ncbi:MAG: undecaprenyl-diphosphatase UppP [Anaerolineales bacterium]|nr:MAG: undecaprenyl-diphosphatase UppP [Anaerolineales bacterium]
MNSFHAILLGIVQGLTEFIPVSSTAHLLITQNLLGIPADGAMFSFLVIVQLGTLVSLFAFYWNDLLSIAKSTLQALPIMFTKPRDTWNLTPDTWLGIYIIVATIPALIAGYLLRDAVEALFRQPMLQASIRLFSAATLLTLAEWLTKKDRRLNSMTWLDAFVVGLFQIIAVFPGASRSGSTISGGMFRGFDRPSAARFAFLMSVPVMLAAGGYEMLDVLQMPNFSEFLPLLAVGFVSAAGAGWLAIRWLIAYLSKHSLYAFAIYCAVAGALVFLLR